MKSSLNYHDLKIYFGEISSKKFKREKPAPFCCSDACRRKYRRKAICGHVYKEVSNDAFFCPDCGYALVWTNINKLHKLHR